MAYALRAPVRSAVSRAELFLWLSCLLFLNDLIRVPPASGLAAGLLESLSLKSAFYYLAWFVVVRLLSEASHERRAGLGDVALALAIAATNVISARSVPSLGATALGVYLLVASGGDRKLQAAAAVLIALAFNGLWGPVLFDLIAPPLLLADAAFVGTLLAATQPGMSWDQTVVGTLGGHSVLVYGPCSSFHNISLGLLCWVAVTKLVRTAWVPKDVAFAAAVVAAVIVLNASRLYLMALSPAQFAYWHEGFGASLFGWVAAAVALAISLWGAVGARPAR